MVVIAALAPRRARREAYALRACTTRLPLWSLMTTSAENGVSGAGSATVRRPASGRARSVTLCPSIKILMLRCAAALSVVRQRSRTLPVVAADAQQAHRRRFRVALDGRGATNVRGERLPARSVARSQSW